MNTRESYQLAFRFWRLYRAQERAWECLSDNEQYGGIDSPAVDWYDQCWNDMQIARCAYIRAGVPETIMMAAQRSMRASSSAYSGPGLAVGLRIQGLTELA